MQNNMQVPLSPAQLYEQNRQRQSATTGVTDDPFLTQAAAAYGAMPGNEGLVIGSLVDVSQMPKARPEGIPEDVLLHPATGQPLVDPATGLFQRRKPHQIINPPLPMGEGVEWVALKDFKTTVNGHLCTFSAGEILHDKEQILMLHKQRAPIKPQVVQVIQQYQDVEASLAETRAFLDYQKTGKMPESNKESEFRETEELAKAVESAKAKKNSKEG